MRGTDTSAFSVAGKGLMPCVLSPRRFGQIKLSTSSWPRRQGGWQQQGEVRDLVSPRTRPHPSHIPSSPPPLDNTHACSPCAQIKEASCALGEAGGQGAVLHPTDGEWAAY